MNTICNIRLTPEKLWKMALTSVFPSINVFLHGTVNRYIV